MGFFSIQCFSFFLHKVLTYIFEKEQNVWEMNPKEVESFKKSNNPAQMEKWKCLDGGISTIVRYLSSAFFGVLNPVIFCYYLERNTEVVCDSNVKMLQFFREKTDTNFWAFDLSDFFYLRHVFKLWPSESFKRNQRGNKAMAYWLWDLVNTIKKEHNQKVRPHRSGLHTCAHLPGGGGGGGGCFHAPLWLNTILCL